MNNWDMFKWRRVSVYCLYIACAFMISCAIATRFSKLLENILLGAGIVMVCAFLYINLMYWRCPSCGHRFAMRKGSMDEISQCPYCFKRLREKTPQEIADEEARAKAKAQAKAKAEQEALAAAQQQNVSEQPEDTGSEKTPAQ